MATLATYKKLFDRLEKGPPGTLYVLHGDEDFILEEFLARLEDRVVPPETRAFNRQRLSGEMVDPGELATSLQAYPSMHTHRLVVIKQCELLKQESEEVLERYLDRPSGTTVLVLVYGALDRRRRLAKRLEKVGERIEFKPLREEERGRWLRSRLKRSGLELDAATAAFLLETVTGGVRELDGEVSKLELAYPGGASLGRDQVAVVLGEHRFEDTVWDLTERIEPGREREGVALLARILERGDAPQMIVAALTTSLLKLLRVSLLKQEGVGDREIQRVAGVRPYYFKKTLKQATGAPATWFRIWLENLAWADLELKTAALPRDRESVFLEMAVVASYRGRGPCWEEGSGPAH